MDRVRAPETSETVGFPRLEKAFVRVQTVMLPMTAQIPPKWIQNRAFSDMFYYILTTRMPSKHSVLRGFFAYFRISSERAQDSPGLSQDRRQTPPGRPQDAPGRPEDAPGTSETSGFPSSEQAL